MFKEMSLNQMKSTNVPLLNVNVGEVWAENDRRSVGRTFRVDSLDQDYVFVTVLTVAVNASDIGIGASKRILRRRFRPVASGYRLMGAVEEVPEKKVLKKKAPGKKAPSIDLDSDIVTLVPYVDQFVEKDSVSQAGPLDDEEFVTLVHPRYPSESEMVNRSYERHSVDVWNYVKGKLLG